MNEAWKELKQECAQCRRCGLGETRHHLVFGDGAEDARIMLIGEGPGEQEDLQGLPFVGPAGKLLDDMLEMIYLDRTKVYIANIVKCRPPHNRDPQFVEQKCCGEWLQRQIALVDPAIIVCLGRIAATALIKDPFRITREHGQWFDVNGRRCMAIYHPPPCCATRASGRRRSSISKRCSGRSIRAARRCTPMPDARIRRAAAADLPVLTRLWQTAFGDPPELIGAFYHRFPPQAAAWVVEVNGTVVTAAHLLGGRLHTADGTTLPCAYVYAASTDPAQQGHGYASALMRRFAAEADANGCVLYTLPAEASLYAWYQSVMGTTQTARGTRLRIARAPDMQCPPVIERVSAQEYAALREQALRGRAHVELSAALLAFQADLCDLCGGALVRIASGCAVVERDGAQLLIKELLGTDVLPAVQALLAGFGAQEAQLCVQRPDGAQALAAYRPLSCVAPDVLWGLYLD